MFVKSAEKIEREVGSHKVGQIISFNFNNVSSRNWFFIFHFTPTENGFYCFLERCVACNNIVVLS